MLYIYTINIYIYTYTCHNFCFETISLMKRWDRYLMFNTSSHRYVIYLNHMVFKVIIIYGQYGFQGQPWTIPTPRY